MPTLVQIELTDLPNTAPPPLATPLYSNGQGYTLHVSPYRQSPVGTRLDIHERLKIFFREAVW